jgi:hypothetical protein
MSPQLRVEVIVSLIIPHVVLHRYESRRRSLQQK